MTDSPHPPAQDHQPVDARDHYRGILALIKNDHAEDYSPANVMKAYDRVRRIARNAFETEPSFTLIQPTTGWKPIRELVFDRRKITALHADGIEYNLWANPEWEPEALRIYTHFRDRSPSDLADSLAKSGPRSAGAAARDVSAQPTTAPTDRDSIAEAFRNGAAFVLARGRRGGDNYINKAANDYANGNVLQPKPTTGSGGEGGRERIAQIITDNICFDIEAGDRWVAAGKAADEILALTNSEALASMEEIANLRGEVVAWGVKDFADGWILCQTESYASHLASEMGAVIRPLYAILPANQEVERLRAALNSIFDVSERMNPDQGFNSQGRLSRCADIARLALAPVGGEGQ